MNREQRSALALGVVLLLVGIFFLAMQLLPALGDQIEALVDWPWIIIGIGVLLLIIGLLTGAPGMAAPAAVVAGIGGILYWQNATGRWESWAYMWALIPGFAGVGRILAGLLGDDPRRSFAEGFRTILVSLILFTIFATFLGGMDIFGPYWPLLLILLGLWLLLKPFTRRARREEPEVIRQPKLPGDDA